MKDQFDVTCYFM